VSRRAALSSVSSFSSLRHGESAARPQRAALRTGQDIAEALSASTASFKAAAAVAAASGAAPGAARNNSRALTREECYRLRLDAASNSSVTASPIKLDSFGSDDGLVGSEGGFRAATLEEEDRLARLSKMEFVSPVVLRDKVAESLLRASMLAQGVRPRSPPTPPPPSPNSEQKGSRFTFDSSEWGF